MCLLLLCILTIGVELFPQRCHTSCILLFPPVVAICVSGKFWLEPPGLGWPGVFLPFEGKDSLASNRCLCLLCLPLVVEDYCKISREVLWISTYFLVVQWGPLPGCSWLWRQSCAELLSIAVQVSGSFQSSLLIFSLLSGRLVPGC